MKPRRSALPFAIPGAATRLLRTAGGKQRREPRTAAAAACFAFAIACTPLAPVGAAHGAVGGPHAPEPRGAGAGEARADPARALIRLMRSDEIVVASLAVRIRTKCRASPASSGNDCDALASRLVREIDRERLVELLAPFLAETFSGDELEAMARFYRSDDGKRLTSLMTGMDWSSPRTVPFLDPALSGRIEAYMQSPVARKFAGVVPQFSEEARRRVGPYLCATLEPRGQSCESLPEAAGVAAWAGFVGAQLAEERFQQSADRVRAAHLIEWAQLIEAYHRKVGRYPLQDRVAGKRPLLVQIATREQQAYLDPKSGHYQRNIDNKIGPYDSVPVKDWIAEIERGLGRAIDERYDPQRVPNGAPVYLSYFATKDGYLIWTVCRTCPPRSNTFSTLLWTGTPSVNIGSDWFIANVRKTHSIASLRANAEFVEFVANGPPASAWFAELARAQVHDSKN